MNAIYALPMMLANVDGAKPGSVESLFGPLGELLNALLTAIKWYHRGEGFAACLVLVVLTILFAMVAGAVSGLIKRNNG